MKKSLIALVLSLAVLSGCSSLSSSASEFESSANTSLIESTSSGEDTESATSDSANSSSDSSSSETSTSSSSSSSSSETSSSSSSSSSSSETSSSSSSSSSSSETSASSSSSESSEEEPVQQTLTISRDTWPSLAAYPGTGVVADVSFGGLAFKYAQAGNYTNGYIQGKKNEFKLYNVDSLTHIDQIVMTLRDAATTYMYAGTSAEPTAPTITPSIGGTVYTYDFSIGNYSHFNLKNGGAAIYIQSLVITYTASGGTTIPDTGDGFYQAGSPTISRDDYNQAAENYALGSLGTQKLLVIPVFFTDYAMNATAQNAWIDKIDAMFFGATEDTGWESVSSFYEKSSYGHLNLTGIVTPFYNAGVTTTAFSQWADVRNPGLAGYYDPTWSLLEDAVAWYKTFSGSSLDEYDTDGDGYIDAVWLVYANPYSTGSTYGDDRDDVFWAYTYWDYDNYYEEYIETTPATMTYAWASVYFMSEGYGDALSEVDAHTFIHETGHILGLDDYYTYDYDDYGAAGGLDMMDYNVLDHNAYTKYLMEWTSPIVVDNSKASTSITLAPFESSGEFVLINNTWNGSPYDEYLLLEFYTPTGLNQSDSAAEYANGVQGFTVPGIKIYHIDSRLGKYSASTGAFSSYTDTLSMTSSYYPYVAMSNTASYSQVEDYKLVHLLDKGHDVYFSSSGIADNGSLFVQGDSFSPAAYSSSFPEGGRFNDYSAIGYSISFTSITNEQAVVQINRI